MTRLTISKALQALSSSQQPFVELFQHGSLCIEYYKPHLIDHQQPHIRDEIYCIAYGSGWLLKDGNKQPIEVGEVVFVPAGMNHRFLDFTDDFATWVIFFGPEGGESL